MRAPERIEKLRREIDSLDHQIVELLNRRAACAHAIGEEKQQQDVVAFAPAREQAVLRAVATHNQGPLADEAVQAIYREIISACRSLEHPITVAYWGPPASNTHVAARQRFGPKAVFVALDSVADVFAEVEHERADFGGSSEDPGQVLAAAFRVELETHLAQLEADIPVEPMSGQRIERRQILVGGGGCGVDRRDRLAEHVDRGSKAGGVELLERHDRLVEGLAGDEPGDHRASERNARREAAEGSPAGEPQERSPHRPLGRGAEGGGGRHRPMVAARPVG